MLRDATKAALEIAKMLTCPLAFAAWLALFNAVYRFSTHNGRRISDPWFQVRIARNCYVPDWGEDRRDPGYTSKREVCIIKAARP